MSHRIPTTNLELPYKDNDLRVPVNGVHSNDIFNNRIQLLVSNFDYILDAAAVIDNRSPDNYTYAYEFTGETWSSNPSSISVGNHGYNFVEVVEMFNGKFLYICGKNTEIDFFIGGDISVNDTDSLTSKITYNQIKQNGNQLYKNISYIKYDSERLYVYDSEYMGLVVYDISPLLYGDTAVESIRFVKQLSQIKNLKAVDFSTNIYAVTETELIILNRDLNIKSKATLANSSPERILVGNDIYVIYSDKIDFYNITLDFIKSVDFESINGDLLIDVDDSKVDDNIIYLLSQEYLYKYDISNDIIVNYFKLGYTNNKNFVDVFVKDGVNNDHIFLTDENKIHFMKDSINLVYLYNRDNLQDIQTLSDIQISDLELEQDFVFNSSFQRVLFNNLLLYNSLIYKAVAITDENGFLEYSYKKNLSNTDTINPNTIYIGQNEVFSYQVFQRAFKEILDIQSSILSLIAYEYTENSTNTLSI